MAGSTGRKLRKTARRAKKSVRRSTRKAKRKVGGAAKTLKRGAAKAKDTAVRARKAVRRASKKAKKTVGRAKKAARKATKKVKRKARKARIAGASAEREVARQAIGATRAQLVDAIHRGDAAQAAALYTEQAVLLPPGHTIVRGRPAIQAYWASAVDELRPMQVAFEPVALDVSPRRAEEIGRHTIMGERGPIESGTFVAIWTRELGGVWRMRVSIWNSDGPAPPSTGRL